MLHIKKNSYKDHYKIYFVLLILYFISFKLELRGRFRLKARFFPLLLIVILAGDNSAYCYSLGNIDLKINGAVSQSFNDNITFVTSESKEDFITKASIGLDAEYKKRTGSFSVSGNLAREIFNNNNDLSNNSGNYKLRFIDEFSKYNYINFENYFARESEPRNFEDPFGKMSGRYSLYLNRISLEYLREIKKQMGLSVKYSNDINEYSNEDQIKSYLNGIYINGNYAAGPESRILLLYEYSKRKFNNGDIASKHLMSTGMLTDLTKTLYMENKAGITFITAYDDEKHIKPVIYSSITGDIDEDTNAKISFEKQYDTIPYLQSILKYWQISGQFNKLLIKTAKNTRR